MTFYKVPNSVRSQIESAGLNFRFRYCCWGIAPKGWHTPKKKQSLYTRFFPRISLKFNYHSHQADQWVYFNISLFKKVKIWLISWGERNEEYPKSAWGGLHVSINKKHLVIPVFGKKS